MKPREHSKDAFVLPVGTVTLLLSDQAGSVDAWESDAGAMSEAVARLDALISDAVGRHRGVRPVEQGEGDSFVAAFARASDALACALDIQLATQADDWPGRLGPRLRMALHTGEVQLRDEGNYVGRTINRCGRLRSLAAGGQVLVSRSTAELVADALPEHASMIDLGTHRLRDLARPEQIFQLAHPGLASAFPALRSLDEVPNNLPVQLTNLVGRRPELAELAHLLDECRLLTLVGSGGCGKTRLALQAAADATEGFVDGAWFVDLAPLGDPGMLPRAVADAFGVKEEGARDVTATVLEHLQSRRALVLLDNCEHVIDAAATFADALLRACPSVTLLATSREPLDVDGELCWRVPSMSLPADDEPAPVEALATSDAVRLFVERAAHRRPSFRMTDENASAIAAICRRLDGIPLAIELAAARIRALSPRQISDHLDDRFRVLTGGLRTAMPRQQTLEASVAWGYDLLDEREQTLLRRLTIFSGGFTLELAEAVCSAEPLDQWGVFDVLCSLVDKSLVQADEGELARYRLLETVRQFGRGHLRARGEEDELADRHLATLVELVERIEPELYSGADQNLWLDTVGAEHANLRAALDWAESADRSELGLRLATATTQFWYTRGYLQEGFRRTQRMLGATPEPTPALEARATFSLGVLGWNIGEYVAATAAGTRSLELATALGDPLSLARAHSLLGFIWLFPDTRGAIEHLEQGRRFAAECDDPYSLANSSCFLGVARAYCGSHADSVAAFEQGAAIAIRRNRPQQLGMTLTAHAFISLWNGSGDAEALLADGRAALEQVDDVLWLLLSSLVRAELVRRRGDAPESVRLSEETLDAGLASGSPFVIDLAMLISGAAVALCREILLMPYVAFGLTWLADVLRALGRTDDARAAADEALEISRSCGYRQYEADALACRAAIATADGDDAEAEDLAHQALRIAREISDRIGSVDCLEQLAAIAARQESYKESARILAAAAAEHGLVGLRAFQLRVAAVARTKACVIDALGRDEFETAWAEGAAMSIDDAVAYASRGRGGRKRPSSGWASLTPTEREVVRLTAEGLTNPKIAERLFVAPSTVKGHLSSIFTKLGYTTRAELAAEAARRAM